ncbi:adenylate/guanylate cyclase domain-containing protein [Pontibacter sp. G13]|uniref:adenylate/guanylate cyclase domain-containing protein n=1 Tax=Pontibacter sp. G13 TaxID=3074898 RepID=UPI00288B840A|nr:adenylate/guanylate cyclase domain-containing protein [Pontibacter sp. G13]WNJ18024.1 adenylate/guanylate cyclase domain-containing protein [Pontibacter sp. G13]
MRIFCCQMLLMVLGMGLFAQSPPASPPEIHPEAFPGMDHDLILRNTPQILFEQLCKEISEDSGSGAELGGKYLLYARAAFQLGRYDDCLDASRHARFFYHQVHDSLGASFARHLEGRVHGRWGNYSKALELQRSAMDYFAKSGHLKGIALCQYWIGITHENLGRYHTARTYYSGAMGIAQVLKDSLLQANILNHEGRAWRKERQLDNALSAHEKSYALYVALNDQVGISDYHNNLGSIFRRKGELNTALAHFLKALEIQEELNDIEGITDGTIDIGRTYLQMGAFQSSRNYLERALVMAQKVRLKDDVRYAHQVMSHLYDSLNDYRRSLYHYRQMVDIRDSLRNEQTLNQIDQLRQDQEIQRQRAQMAQFKLQQEIRANRTQQMVQMLILGLIFILLVLGGILWRLRLQRRHNSMLTETNDQLKVEQEKSDALLLNILPAEIAKELREKPQDGVRARNHEEVSVLFCDFEGFSQIAEQLTPEQLVDQLHRCFEGLDRIVEEYKLEKIKTIGDAYMCASGIPSRHERAAVDIVRAALDMQVWLEWLNRERAEAGMPLFRGRIGIHTGPVIAGVVGIRKFAYDIWGDTVNIASRMESSGTPGKVNISESTYELVKNHFICTHRGKILAKNKGEIDMYFVEEPVPAYQAL